MTTKQLKFYQILKEINTLNVFIDGKRLVDCIKQAIALDYFSAVEIWEFLILDSESALATDIPLAFMLCDKIIEVFEAKANAKYVKTLSENAAVCRAVYQYSPTCFAKAETIAITAGYLASSKLDVADQMLSCAFKNNSNKKTVGEFMKAVIEKLFIEVLKKSTDGKIRIARKTSDFLLGYVNKIKTPEKALLTQRIKETL